MGFTQLCMDNYIMILFFNSCGPRPSKATWAMEDRPCAQAKIETWFLTIGFLPLDVYDLL